jgi:hypothetical protein
MNATIKPRPPWDPEHKRPEAPPGYRWTNVKVGAARCLHCLTPISRGEDAMLWIYRGYIHEACWPLAEPGR